MHTHTHTHTCMHVYTHMHACTHTRTHTHTHMHIHMHTQHPCTRACACTHMHVCTYVYTHNTHVTIQYNLYPYSSLAAVTTRCQYCFKKSSFMRSTTSYTQQHDIDTVTAYSSSHYQLIILYS